MIRRASDVHNNPGASSAQFPGDPIVGEALAYHRAVARRFHPTAQGRELHCYTGGRFNCVRTQFKRRRRFTDSVG